MQSQSPAHGIACQHTRLASIWIARGIGIKSGPEVFHRPGLALQKAPKIDCASANLTLGQSFRQDTPIGCEPDSAMETPAVDGSGFSAFVGQLGITNHDCSLHLLDNLAQLNQYFVVFSTHLGVVHHLRIIQSHGQCHDGEDGPGSHGGNE